MTADLLSPASADAPIGIFDSGVGGLSVLRHVRTLLPHERLLYAADSGHAPYGERSETEVVERALAVTKFLLSQGVKALVVACNTATAAAVASLRQQYPELILVGVEPGLKPAAQLTACSTVGVLATASTLNSERFIALQRQIELSHEVKFFAQACNGLAAQIEKGELDTPATRQLVEHYVGALLAEAADVLVLGCTHYPFVLPLIEQAISQHGGQDNMTVKLVDTGDAVARQLYRLLSKQDLLRSASLEGTLEACTSGSETALRLAFERLLGLNPPVSTMRA